MLYYWKPPWVALRSKKVGNKLISKPDNLPVFLLTLTLTLTKQRLFLLLFVVLSLISPNLLILPPNTVV